MTDVGEGMGPLEGPPKANDLCDRKNPECETKKVKLHRHKGYEASPEVLRTDMLNVGELDDPKPPHDSPPWDLMECDTNYFPYQTHHLIPKATLTPHPVCVWLTDTPETNATKYKLATDTDYSIDCWYNGLFMPFASNTKQWESAGTNSTKKKNICWEMMRRTEMQLHQGKHTKTDYLEDVNDIETDGYITRTEKLLLQLAVDLATHVDACKKCSAKKDGGKIVVPPLKGFVRHMYGISRALESAINLCEIFVSRKAANYFEANRDINGNVQHSSEPYV